MQVEMARQGECQGNVNAGGISRCPPPAADIAAIAFLNASVFNFIPSPTPPKFVILNRRVGITGGATFMSAAGSVVGTHRPWPRIQTILLTKGWQLSPTGCDFRSPRISSLLTNTTQVTQQNNIFPVTNFEIRVVFSVSNGQFQVKPFATSASHRKTCPRS